MTNSVKTDFIGPNVYAEKAINSLPRLLTLLDREPTSKTFGCFHRDYWLYKTSDFPDMVRQFGVLSLALVYKHPFFSNPYFGNPKIARWAAASIEFWASQQHGDGSFDEFYPYERGWVGPTAFTAYACAESCRLFGDALPKSTQQIADAAIRKSALFICRGDREKDSLANHHAMACLAVWKAYQLTGDERFARGFEERWQEFLTYHNQAEGWSREYDGIDPGYLSASVSFLSKIYKDLPKREILSVLRQSVETCALFARPDGDYAGNLGSRNTQHFYAHGFEVVAGSVPVAGALAEHHLKGLASGRVVPPEIMSDRYVFYRVPELLEAYLDYTPRTGRLPRLPFEQSDFQKWLPEAGIFATTRGPYYLIASTAKGGVLKVFDRKSGNSVLADSGIVGRFKDGRAVTNQWIDKNRHVSVRDGSISIQGHLHFIPSNKIFSLAKFIIFRSVLFLLGWHAGFCHLLKGKIRSALILKSGKAPVAFERHISLTEKTITIDDELIVEGANEFTQLSFGGERFLRFVPQSRFFQKYELSDGGVDLNTDCLKLLKEQKKLRLRTILVDGERTYRIITDATEIPLTDN